MIPLTRLPLPSLLEATGAARDRAMARAPQAEWGLVHQGARILLTRDQASGWLVRPTGRRLVALGLPLGPADLVGLRRTPRAQGLAPLLYKCDAQTALAARREGWSVARVGHEAILDLAGWSADRPACRQLRRKLRVAAPEAVRIEEAQALPFDQMEAVAQAWSGRAGQERGFSMGRIDPRLLGRQRVLLAWKGEALVAFASFHARRTEWALDLMRHRAEAPGGTMHRLIVEAVARAKATGAERLSLAAILDPPLPTMLAARPSGLAQFKLSFGPRLAPRYAAAPHALALASGLARVAWAINRTEALSPSSDPAPIRAEPMHRRAGRNFTFDPCPGPCDAPPAQPIAADAAVPAAHAS